MSSNSKTHYEKSKSKLKMVSTKLPIIFVLEYVIMQQYETVYINIKPLFCYLLKYFLKVDAQYHSDMQVFFCEKTSVSNLFVSAK